MPAAKPSPAAAAASSAGASASAFTKNRTYGPAWAVTDVLVWGRGSDWSVFREIPFVQRAARIGLRLVPFALPAAVGATWFVYPALTENFKKEYRLP